MTDDPSRRRPSSDPLAEAWTERAGGITLAQARVLLTAAQWAGMNVSDLATMICAFSTSDRPEDITPTDYEWIIDRFVGWGFRHPALPLVSSAQFACLNEGRRRLGLGGRQFVAVMRREASAAGRRQLDGVGFLKLWLLFNGLGAGVPVPEPGFMNRKYAGLLHMAAYRAGVSADTFAALRMHLGGVPRLALLDRRAFARMLARFEAMGVPAPDPAPLVPAMPGMATQAQANLIWRMWLDLDGWKGNTTPATLDLAIASMLGMEGGLASLTRAGTRALIDRFIVPRMNDRRAAESAKERTRPCDPT
ncbi:MAG TPA: hypothetical protein VH414_03840 [Lichenihabitans sp.]|jgi:hypothetical protein|nr:hypothetical protein [Lichenihabitans sp.]